MTIMDAPDIERWLKGGELLLANTYVMKDSREAQIALIHDILRKDVACLAIKLHRYVEELPREMLDIADRSNFPIIQVPVDVAWTEVISPVLSAIYAKGLGMLEYSMDVHDRFTALALGGGDIAEITIALQNLLSREVIIARTGTPSIRVRGETSWSVTPIRVASRVIGHICVDVRGRPLRDEDEVAIGHAATMSALAFLKDDAVSESRRRLGNDFLSSLLEGAIKDQALMRDMTRDLGWDTSGSFAVLVVEADPWCSPERLGDGSRGRVPGAYKDLVQRSRECIRRAIPGVLFLDREAMLIAFIPGKGHVGPNVSDPKDMLEFGERIKRETGDVADGMTFSIGIGRLKPNIIDTSSSFNEAITALHLGRAIRGNSLVHHFEATSVTRLLYDRRNDQDVLKFCDEVLGGLESLRDTDRTVLIDSACAYFRFGRSIARAASALIIHPNTLRYRLAKLEDMCGLDLDDPEDQLGLEIALRIHSISRA